MTSKFEKEQKRILSNKMSLQNIWRLASNSSTSLW